MYDLYMSARSDTSPLLLHIFDQKNGTHASWSSLVGIVTAIIGNILISFALNTQRYAHIRIDREYHDGQEKRHAKNGLSRSAHGYGAVAQQEQAAEERERLNAEASGPGNADDSTDAFGQTKQPKTSSGTNGTAKPRAKDEDDNQGRKSYLKSPYWWVGIILMTIGEAGNFLAYGFAPASIVSPLGVVALISNCLIAPLMLKERFRKRDFWGVLIAIGGAVTVVLSAKTSETKMGPDDLWHSIKRWEFLTYIGITLVFIVVLMIASPRYGKRTILIDLGLVGLFGGYTALSTKGVASMISGSLFQALTFPITYALVLVLVASAIMQIRYINRALSNFNSTQVIPTQFVLFTLSVIIGSAVLYRDFEKTDLDHVIKFIVGCFLTFSGVWLITSGRRNRDDSGDDGDGVQDDTIHLIDEEAEEEDERTPTKREHMSQINTNIDTPKAPQRESIDNSDSQPSASPSTPAISITSYDDPLKQNPWISSSENLDSMVRPITPPNPREITSAETPFFTPSSAPGTTRQGRIGILGRTETSPADPQTPTKANRAPSPPKPDIPALAPGEAYQTPQSNIFNSARGSISRLLPGPFLGALSSGSLNTVVAESLLRGEGSPGGPLRTRTFGRRTRPIPTARVERNRRRSATGISGLEATDLESGITAPLLSRWQTHDSQMPDLNRHHSDQFYNTQDPRMEGSSRTGFLPSLSPTLSKFMSIMKERGKDKATDRDLDPDPGGFDAGPSSRTGSHRK